MNAEDQIQRDFLYMPSGAKGSGYTRYAAAMYFHQRGRLSDQALEAYRTLAKDDQGDPTVALHSVGCIVALDHELHVLEHEPETP